LSELRPNNKIVSVTVALADEDDFAGMNEERLKWFPSNPPARQGAGYWRKGKVIYERENQIHK